MAAWRGRWKWVAGRPLLADTLLAGALFVTIHLLAQALPREAQPDNGPRALAVSALALATVAIRRRWLWVAVPALAAITALATALGVGADAVASLVITYTAAAHLTIVRSAIATVLVWTPVVVVTAIGAQRAPSPIDLTPTAFLVMSVMTAMLAYLAGRIVFTRRRYVAALVERARAAEENQQALAVRAVQDERRRIARELHDMVAHHVSVMGVLATGSRRILRQDPQAADEALATIEETGRTTLREMRRLIDVMRTDPEPADPLTPQPDLAGLAQLVEQVREAGLMVNLVTSVAVNNAPTDNAVPHQRRRPAAPLSTVDPGIALTVYRIVQEALTNVLKHGGPQAAAEVRLDLGGGWVTLEVFDTGRGPLARPAAMPDGVGHGLLGMRERVALYGGTLRTGPRPGGGFRVFARIPLEEGVA